MTPGSPKVMVITHGLVDPASRFRAIQYFPFLEAAGWQIVHRPKRPLPREPGTRPGAPRILSPVQRLLRKFNRRRDIQDASRCDVVFLNRDILGGDPRREQHLIRANPAVVFDFDDAIDLGRGRSAHFEWICRKAKWITAGNEFLAERARRFSERVSVLPTVVSTETYEIKNYSVTEKSPLKVGWLGSGHSMDATLTPFLPVLAEISKRTPMELVVVSSHPPVPPPGITFHFQSWSPEVEVSIARLFDVGIMPLDNSPFQSGKCGLKILQYMAAGLPVIASPSGINGSLLAEGRGFAAESTSDWTEAIDKLNASPELRKNLGLSGRKFCEANYSLSRYAPELDHILRRAAERAKSP